MTLSPCPHREVIPGPLATGADLAAWAAELAAEPCPRCAAPLPLPAPHPDLPPEVAEALRWEGRTGARRAQATLDALEVGAELLPAVARRLSEQPATGPWWRRWWAGWQDGAVIEAEPC